MSTPTIFFTGFPGFLGVELLPRVLRRRTDARAVCLVQHKFLDVAEARAKQLMTDHEDLSGRIELVVGDITAPDLGLGDAHDELAASTVEIHHLAAIYDLSIPRDIAMKVNVDGTRHVCDFAEACDDLDRLHYVSTCYVSGRHTGIFREDDLVVAGQEFNNFYEETKHLAEVVVRERMAMGLPATIYRPAVVAGDSRTGETQKLDGIYFVMRWALKQPFPFAILPIMGDPTMVRFNVVPRDFVVDAIAELSGREDTVGQCYALADPMPYRIDELLDLVSEFVAKTPVKVQLPLGLAKFAIRNIPGVLPLLGIPADAANYFVHPAHYDTTNTQAALAGTGIGEYDRKAWFGALVEFTRRNMDMTSDAMR